jgi:hypothetical protein
MDRPQEMRIGQALNEAIHLRDNVHQLTHDEILAQLKSLSRHGVFSARQLSAIADGKVSHHAITRMIEKKDKTGGNLNAGTLDILRNLLYSRANGSTDYKLVADAVSRGTSQGMVAKLTGIPQGTISKKIREGQ